MGDMGETFNAMKAADKERRHRNLQSADPAGWTQHTPYHWSRQLNGKRLDYWPTRNKFRYDGRVRIGDVKSFIRKHLSHA